MVVLNKIDTRTGDDGTTRHRRSAQETGEEVSPAALKSVNRLSDFFFFAARYLNDKGASDILWQPGQNR